MNTRIFTSMVVVAVVLAALIFAWTIIHALFYAPDSELRAPYALSPVASTASAPARLQIPSLHIDAHVQHVGINGRNEMAIPSNFQDVGWYKYGPVPGQSGNAVIDGHVDNGLGLPGVFRHLDDIRVGDDVYIITKDGSKLHFVVNDIQSYPYADAPTNRIFGYANAANLNLITCTGSWIASKRTYSTRLVVYTTFTNS